VNTNIYKEQTATISKKKKFMKDNRIDKTKAVFCNNITDHDISVEVYII